MEKSRRVMVRRETDGLLLNLPRQASHYYIIPDQFKGTHLGKREGCTGMRDTERRGG